MPFFLFPSLYYNIIPLSRVWACGPWTPCASMCCVFLSLPHHSLPFFRAHKFPSPSHSSSTTHLSLSLSLSSLIIYTTLLGSVKNTASLQHSPKSHSYSFFLHLLLCLLQRIWARMRNQSSVKQEFLRKWITGLRRCTSQKKNMSFLERKKAIKLSADLAMASTRDKTTRWSQALIAKASRDDNNNNKVITEHVIGSSSPSQNNKVSKNNYCTSTNNSTTRSSSSSSRSRIIRSKKILRRIRTVPKAKEERVAASFIAKRLVQKRTRKLRSLLPGGEFMDEVSLVEETLDYIESLRAQVEVMRCLVTASELFINNPSS